jgi:hypothetical protein
MAHGRSILLILGGFSYLELTFKSRRHFALSFLRCRLMGRAKPSTQILDAVREGCAVWVHNAAEKWRAARLRLPF